MPPAWEEHNFQGLIAACRKNKTGVMAIRIFTVGVVATDHRTGRKSIQYKNESISAEEARARTIFDTFGDEYGARAQIAVRFA